MQVIDHACCRKAGKVVPSRIVDVIDITAQEKLNPRVPVMVVEFTEIARKLFQGIASGSGIGGYKVGLDGEKDRALDLFGGQIVQNPGGMQAFNPAQCRGRSGSGPAVTITHHGLSLGILATEHKGCPSQKQRAQ